MDHDSDDGAENGFGGRRLMSVPENLDEELSMEFDSDKEKNQIVTEDASEMKSNSDASMSSKDSNDPHKANTGDSWTDEERSAASLGAECQNESVEENPIQVYKRPMDLVPAQEPEQLKDQCKNHAGVKSFLQ